MLIYKQEKLINLINFNQEINAFSKIIQLLFFKSTFLFYYQWIYMIRNFMDKIRNKYSYFMSVGAIDIWNIFFSWNKINKHKKQN